MSNREVVPVLKLLISETLYYHCYLVKELYLLQHSAYSCLYAAILVKNIYTIVPNTCALYTYGLYIVPVLFILPSWLQLLSPFKMCLVYILFSMFFRAFRWLSFSFTLSEDMFYYVSGACVEINKTYYINECMFAYS